MSRLVFSTSNSQITDEVHNVASSSAFKLYHDSFYNKTGKLVVISTGAGGSGTVLTISTDYSIGGAFSDSDLPISITPDVAYSTVSITNATYHDTDLYFSYYPLGDLVEVADLPIWQINDDTTPEWDAAEATAYDSAEYTVKKYGLHITSTGESGNSNKNPFLPANKDYWYFPPAPEDLIRYALTGVPVMGDMHPIHDRAGSNYATSFKIDTREVDGTSYDFFAIHLDGSTVTGDATLVARLGVGGANEHPYVDIFAPDSLGTRTLIDGGERTISGQSSGGESDTLGEMQEDRFQQFDIGQKSSPTSRLGVDASVGGGVGASGNTRFILTGGILGANGFSLISDGTHGTPRTGLTTRGKGIVGGCPYIISMIPA